MLKNKIVDFLFKNQKIIFLFFVFLVLFGGYSLSQMKKQGFPDVSVNIVSVNVVYPNASENQVEDEILKPLESALKDIEDVESFQTVAANSFGTAIVTLNDQVEVDTVIAEMNEKFSSLKLPEDAKEPSINKFSTAGTGEFMVAVADKNDVWDLYKGGSDLSDKLGELEGVKEVIAQNALTPEIIILFDEAKLSEKGLSRNQIEDIIRNYKFKAPVGSYVDNEKTVSIILEKNIESFDDFKNILVSKDLYLKDVANITISLNNNDKYNRIGFREDGEDSLQIERALVYSIKIENDADILEVEERVNGLLESLNEQKNGKYLMLYNQADATRMQIEEITQSIFGKPIDSLGSFAFLGYLFGGLGFVVLLLFLFMNSRVAILAALSIPMSLFFSMIYLNLAGIQLNTLVLFSMVLTIGLVVDPTIVFLESLQRFKDQGFGNKEAAIKTWSTVGSGVFLAVATNIIVFVPFGVVSGFFGQIIKYIPVTVIPAMVASMFIPAVFFTVIASKMFKKGKNNTNLEDSELIGSWVLGRWIGRSISFILGKTKPRFVLRVFLFLVLLSSPIIIGGVLFNTGRVEVVQFAEQNDSEFILVNGDVSKDVSFDQAAYGVAVPVQDILKEIKEVKNFSFYLQNGNSFSILVELFPIEDRKQDGLRTSDEVSKYINEKIKELNLGATVEASTSSEGPPQDSYPVRIRIFDNDTEVLLSAVADVRSFLSTVEGVSKISDNISSDKSGASVIFSVDNKNQNAQAFMIFSTINSYLSQNNLGTLALDGYNFDIVSKLRNKAVTKEDILNLKVITTEDIIYKQAYEKLLSQGVKDPEKILGPHTDTKISDLIDESEEKDSITIRRTNGKRFVEISAGLDEGVNAIDVQNKLKDYLSEEKIKSLGLGVGSVDFEGGEANSISKSFNDLFVALIIAIFLIYVLLVGFFRSFVQPFIILFAIPLGLVGVFLAIWATTGQLGFLELLGVVTMAGIVVNVTILLLDYANQLKLQGRSSEDAIATAVAVRFRPIVLTQLTAFGSLISLVFISPFWKGLAASIIFGILSSAILSLFLTPILYKWSDSFAGMLSYFKNKILILKSKLLWKGRR